MDFFLHELIRSGNINLDNINFIINKYGQSSSNNNDINNMRNFHSMPNTTIPNGQKAFAEFCYGNMPSCKDGDGQQCSKINRRVGGVYY